MINDDYPVEQENDSIEFSFVHPFALLIWNDESQTIIARRTGIALVNMYKLPHNACSHCFREPAETPDHYCEMCQERIDNKDF